MTSGSLCMYSGYMYKLNRVKVPNTMFMITSHFIDNRKNALMCCGVLLTDIT
jgi:hypothetical protein